MDKNDLAEKTNLPKKSIIILTVLLRSRINRLKQGSLSKLVGSTGTIITPGVIVQVQGAVYLPSPNDIVYRVFQDSCPKNKFRYLILWKGKQAVIGLLVLMRSYNLFCYGFLSDKSIFPYFCILLNLKHENVDFWRNASGHGEIFYANGSSWTNARRALQKKYGDKARKIHLKTIQRQITKFERDLTLMRPTRVLRP